MEKAIQDFLKAFCEHMTNESYSIGDHVLFVHCQHRCDNLLQQGQANEECRATLQRVLDIARERNLMNNPPLDAIEHWVSTLDITTLNPFECKALPHILNMCHTAEHLIAPKDPNFTLLSPDMREAYARIAKHVDTLIITMDGTIHE